MLFVSAIPPHNSSSLNLFAANCWNNNAKLPEKYFIKNSYLILAWFYYLKLVTYNKSGGGKSDKTKQFVRFAILPTKRTHYTLTKAPMAHKTNSKEQFEFKFYFMLATFKGFTEDLFEVGSCDAAALLILITSKFFPVFSTNTLFLKSSRVFFTYHDCDFYSYYRFISNTSSSSTLKLPQYSVDSLRN